MLLAVTAFSLFQFYDKSMMAGEMEALSIDIRCIQCFKLREFSKVPVRVNASLGL